MAWLLGADGEWYTQTRLVKLAVARRSAVHNRRIAKQSTLMAAPNVVVKLILLAAFYLFAATGAANAQESATDSLGAIYWTHRGTGVYRAARDGSEMKQLVEIKNPDGLAVDANAQKLYFTVSNHPAANADTIYRINLDGSGIEEIVGGLNFTGDMVLDPDSAKLYLTSVGSGIICSGSKSPKLPIVSRYLFRARVRKQITSGCFLNGTISGAS